MPDNQPEKPQNNPPPYKTPKLEAITGQVFLGMVASVLLYIATLWLLHKLQARTIMPVLPFLLLAFAVTLQHKGWRAFWLGLFISFGILFGLTILLFGKCGNTW
jgi:hypothetical protein